MIDTVMTNSEMVIWRSIAHDLDYEVDKVGRPFRRGKCIDRETGEAFTQVLDWNPLEDDADSFALLVHYGLSVSVLCDRVTVTAARQTHWNGCVIESAAGDLVYAARRAVFLAAGEIVKIRAQLDDLAI